MDTATLGYFKETLTERLQEIVPGMRQNLSILMDRGCYQGPMDDLDLVAERCEREYLLRLQQRVERGVREILVALSCIKRGTFGICEECGRNIELNRLKAQPTATLCLECKRELESNGRRNVA